MGRNIHLWMIVLILICKDVFCVSEADLMKHLLNGYQKSVRPILDPSQRVNVSVDLYLLAITELDERDQIFKTYNWINMTWQDEYLTWDPTTWNDIESIVIPGSLLWKPDFTITNSAKSVYGEIMDQDEDFRVWLDFDGSVEYWTAGEIQTSCAVDITYFPFDDQACFISIDNWIYDTKMVYLQNQKMAVSTDKYRESGQWKVLKTESKLIKEEYEGYLYAEVQFTFYLRRKPMFYICNIIIPSVLLSLLILLIFLLPADAGEKISLGITVLLSFSVFQLLIADSIPRTSDSLPIIGIYVICTMLLTAISLMVSVLILIIHHHDPEKPVPTTLRKITKCLAKVMCMKMIWINQDTTDQEDVGENQARIGQHKFPLQNGYELSQQSSMNAQLYHLIDNISADLEMIMIKLTRNDSTKAFKRDWVQMAKVLDRFMLICFLILILLTLFILFVIYPFTKPDFPKVLSTE